MRAAKCDGRGSVKPHFHKRSEKRSVGAGQRGAEMEKNGLRPLQTAKNAPWRKEQTYQARGRSVRKIQRWAKDEQEKAGKGGGVYRADHTEASKSGYPFPEEGLIGEKGAERNQA